MVNETMRNMRNRIVLQEKRKNPIRSWADASWIYAYSLPTLTSCLITCLVALPYDEAVFQLKSTIQARWIPLSTSLQAKWPSTPSGQLHKWELSEADSQNLLGFYPPENIPDIDVPLDKLGPLF